MSTEQSPDAELEHKIGVEVLRLCTSEKREDRSAAWKELQALCRQRSRERVAQMERERGLR